MSKKSFEKWLNHKFPRKSGTSSSYLRAVEIISIRTASDIYQNTSLKSLTSLYTDLLQNQKVRHGKYFFAEAPSYGLKGFYSAAIKNYIDFLKDGINSSALE